MSKVLIYAGTTEGRLLAQRLSDAGVGCDVQVATEYGQLVMPELSGVCVRVGRLLPEEMRALAQDGYAAIVDATHPFAAEVSKNIRESTEGLSVPCFRLLRHMQPVVSGSGLHAFPDTKSCAQALSKTEGAVLLTTGSKELDTFCRSETLRSRLYVRILPSRESLALCEAAGVSGKQVIAMQGPFSKELDLALIRQYGIRFLVTKASGAHSGFAQKLAAAQEAGIGVCVIGAAPENGMSFAEVCGALSERLGVSLPARPQVQISLIGIGMNASQLTLAARDALDAADCVFGAKRMLAAAPNAPERYPYYRAEDILPVLHEKERVWDASTLNVAVLFSGDTGFYSGAQEVKETFKKNNYDKIDIYSGVSSVSYLSAKTGILWQDAKIVSIHGEMDDFRAKIRVLDAVRHTGKTFLLVSGAADVRSTAAWLEEANLPEVRMIAGFQMAYENEEIRELSREAARNTTEEGLYTLLLLQPHPQPTGTLSGIDDSAFKRNMNNQKPVPMTKKEIRTLALARLNLCADAVVYDIGSGTGSLAVECALLVPSARVYAIEKRPEAQVLTIENITRFNLLNVLPVDGKAPEALRMLPMPTHVFIGGSGGGLREILQTVWEKNPLARVVVTAVSLETQAELTAFLKTAQPPAGNLMLQQDVIQVQVSRAEAAGTYHLMRAENPVWIWTLYWKGETDA